jgi:hypothetical protein
MVLTLLFLSLRWQVLLLQPRLVALLCFGFRFGFYSSGWRTCFGRAAEAAGVWANAVPIAKVVAMIAAITCFMIGPVLSLSLFCVVNLRKPRTQPA